MTRDMSDLITDMFPCRSPSQNNMSQSKIPTLQEYRQEGEGLRTFSPSPLTQRSKTQLDVQKHGSASSIYTRMEDNLSKPNILKKGLLWCSSDKLFLRWKEGYIVLTEDSLHMFKKAGDLRRKMSAMDDFLFR